MHFDSTYHWILFRAYKWINNKSWQCHGHVSIAMNKTEMKLCHAVSWVKISQHLITWSCSSNHEVDLYLFQSVQVRPHMWRWWNSTAANKNMSKVRLLMSNTGNFTAIFAEEEFLQFLNFESRILMSDHTDRSSESSGNEQVPMELLEGHFDLSCHQTL